MLDNLTFAFVSAATGIFGLSADLDIETTQNIYTVSLSSALILFNNNRPDIFDFIRNLGR